MRAFDNGINLCHSDSNISHLPAHLPTIIINRYRRESTVEKLQCLMSLNFSLCYTKNLFRLFSI